MTAQAALTAQNTQGVKAIHEVPTDFVKQQIDACVEDIGVDVVKTGEYSDCRPHHRRGHLLNLRPGMLASAGTITMVADALKQHKIQISVVDPVMAATTGAQLLPEEAIKTLCSDLLPRTYLLTPNIPEANLILRNAGKPVVEVIDVDSLRRLAFAVHNLGPTYVLIKGGHTPLTSDYQVARHDHERQLVANVFVGKGIMETIESPYQHSRNTHGTGCSLACRHDQFLHPKSCTDVPPAAIACNLANGQDVVIAVRAACRYVDSGIRTSSDLGKGSGPLNHFHSLQILPFAP